MEPVATSAVTSAVTTALATVGNDAMGMIAAVLPGALSIAGAVIVVSIGMKVFRRIVGR